MWHPYVSALIAELAPQLNIRVELEPEFQSAGELIFPNGHRHLFNNHRLNINSPTSASICRDKAHTHYFLRKHGFPVPVSKVFFSDGQNAILPPEMQRGLSEAIAYAKQRGFPLFVKPNNSSNGRLVSKVYSLQDFVLVATRIFKKNATLLVEDVCPGRDYRVVVLGNRVILAYERVPLAVVGNARQSINELLEVAKQDLYAERQTDSEMDPSDFRIDIKLSAIGKSRNTVLEAGERVTLLDNANVSTGGTATDLTDSIHPSFARAAIEAVKAMGLRLCGIDVMADDLGSDTSSQSWTILELNACPDLNNHAAAGSTQLNSVKYLYKSILKYLHDDLVEHP